LFKRDVDYMLQDGKVVIVDEFTGRLMPGRRYSDGLHQALEAKEKVRIEAEYQTLASITFQNYFRMYNKLSGMTGTALTEAPEFHSIYKLDVVEVPTNKPLIRLEHDDQIYRSAKEKWNAVVDELRENSEKGRPVLVGTISIENSEHLSRLVYDNDFPVLEHVVHVPFKQGVCLERLIDSMDQVHVFQVIEIGDTEDFFRLSDSLFI